MNRLQWMFAMVLGITALVPTRITHAQWTATKVKEIKGMNAPEGVVVDSETGMAYVSNIETAKQGYWEDDKTGFISRLKPGGELDQLRWRDSTPVAVLNCPKGMCIYKGWLWAADNKRLMKFEIAGKRATRFDFLGAKRLNDMAADGVAVYVTDTAQGKVIRIDDNGGLSTIKGPKS